MGGKDRMDVRHIKGPRPMSLHLSNALSIWQQAPAGAQRLMENAGGWHPSLEADIALLRDCLPDDETREKFQRAVKKKAAARGDDVLAGISRYISHPYARVGSEPELCHRVGQCELYDFGGDGQPVLLVPSLVNPHYVLDLKPGRSIAAYLKSQGYRPFLLKWFEPGDEELGFDVSDYVMKRALPFLEYIVAVGAGPAPVLGYCMGGTLCTALAARAPHLVSALALVAAPWDFASEVPHAGRRYAHVMADMLDRLPEGMPVPVDMLQVFFTSVDPTLTDRKFRRFLSLDPASEAAEFFIALETWANTGAPLARQVAKDVIRGWYMENEPGRGVWQVGGDAVRLEDITCPVWVAAPRADRLVPQESAYAMVSKLRSATTHDPGAGHVGMMVGSKAARGLWAPLVGWLRAQEARHAA
ncbi:alpha/beta fold hydrolase [Kordiimonas aestuarii]|uniref:alpha/beta fold hydrolase n=1 Tax=Kordiimonas aestuarii TaxID=1005925 RepID=UPI0021CF0D0D|nr:alpha/beta fold hydrolase [Kordiimonas aestuarii]